MLLIRAGDVEQSDSYTKRMLVSPSEKYDTVSGMIWGISGVPSVMTTTDAASIRDRMEAALTMTQMSQSACRRSVGQLYPAAVFQLDRQQRQSNHRGEVDHDWSGGGLDRRLGEGNLVSRPSTLIHCSSDVVSGTETAPPASVAAPYDYRSRFTTQRDGRTDIDDETLARMTKEVLQRQTNHAHAPVGKFVRTCSQQGSTLSVVSRTQNRSPWKYLPITGSERSPDAVVVCKRAAEKRRVSETEDDESQLLRPSVSRRSSADEIASTRKTRTGPDRALARQNSDPTERRTSPARRIRPALSAASSAVPARDGRRGFPEKSSSSFYLNQNERSGPAKGGSFILPVFAAAGGAPYGYLMPLSMVNIGLCGLPLQLPVKQVVALKEEARTVRTPPSSISASQKARRSFAETDVAAASATKPLHPDKTRSSSFVGNGYVAPNLLRVPTVVTTASTSEEQPVCVADQAVLKALESVKVKDQFQMETDMDAEEPLDLTSSAPNLAAMKTMEHRRAKWSKYDQLSTLKHGRSSSYGSLSALKAFYDGPTMKSDLKKTQSDSSSSPAAETGLALIGGTISEPPTGVGSAYNTPVANWRAAERNRNADVSSAWCSQFRPRPRDGAVAKSSWSTVLSARTGVHSPGRSSTEASGTALDDGWNQGHEADGTSASLGRDAVCVDLGYSSIRSKCCVNDKESRTGTMELVKPSDGVPVGETSRIRTMDTLELRESPPIVKLSLNERSTEAGAYKFEVSDAMKNNRCPTINEPAATTADAVDLSSSSRSGTLLNCSTTTFSRDNVDLSWRLPLKKRRMLDPEPVPPSVKLHDCAAVEDRVRSSDDEQSADDEAQRANPPRRKCHC